MVLTPSAGDLNLEQLAQLANRIMEASPTHGPIAATNTTDVLTAQVTELTRSTLGRTVNMHRCQRPSTLSPAVPDHQVRHHHHDDHNTRLQPTAPPQPNVSVGATASSGMLHRNAKLSGQSLAATSDPGQRQSRLLFLTDVNSDRRFLTDTGAEVSVVPPSAADRKNKWDCSGLQAVNGSSIATFGTQSDLGLRRVFR